MVHEPGLRSSSCIPGSMLSSSTPLCTPSPPKHSLNTCVAMVPQSRPCAKMLLQFGLDRWHPTHSMLLVGDIMQSSFRVSWSCQHSVFLPHRDKSIDAWINCRKVWGRYNIHRKDCGCNDWACRNRGSTNEPGRISLCSQGHLPTNKPYNEISSF